jgi:hypothetical protein
MTSVLCNAAASMGRSTRSATGGVVFWSRRTTPAMVLAGFPFQGRRPGG